MRNHEDTKNSDLRWFKMENETPPEALEENHNEIDINTLNEVEDEQDMVKKGSKSRPSSRTKYTAVQGYTKSDGTRVRPHLRRVKK